MTTRILIPVLTAAFAIYGVQQESQEDALEAKVQALETRIQTVETYLQARAASSSSISSAIDRAVAKGYTAGINYEARQILVDAWKADIAAANDKVPGAKVSGPTGRVDPRIARRKQAGGR